MTDIFICSAYSLVSVLQVSANSRFYRSHLLEVANISPLSDCGRSNSQHNSSLKDIPVNRPQSLPRGNWLRQKEKDQSQVIVSLAARLCPVPTEGTTQIINKICKAIKLNHSVFTSCFILPLLAKNEMQTIHYSCCSLVFQLISSLII